MLAILDELLFIGMNLISMIGPPLIGGPVAALIFVTLIRKGNEWRLFIFWGLLVLSHLVALVVIALTFGHAFFGPGFFAYATLPGAAAVSLLILAFACPKVWKSLAGDRGGEFTIWQEWC